MAKSKSVKAQDLEALFGEMDEFVVPGSAKRVQGELPPQAKLDEGDTIAGFFHGMRQIQITDQNTKELKDVRVYTFTTKSGKKFAILGRTMLDHAFDETFEAVKGIENLTGMIVRIERGSDSKLARGRTLGNYIIQYWEDGD